ncbi:MAG: OmpH family outer membrane protein [Alphaproteobacteria bacterium]
MVQTSLFRALIVCAFGSIHLAVGGAMAQDGQSAAVIAVVDIEAVMREASAVATAREQLEQIQARYRQEISEEENRLRAVERELQQQRTILAPEIYAQRREQFQKDAAGLNRRVQEVRRVLDGAFESSMRQIQNVLFEEIGKMAREEGVNVVLQRSQIVFARNVSDFTATALSRLDQRLPSVKIEVTENSPQQ